MIIFDIILIVELEVLNKHFYISIDETRKYCFKIFIRCLIKEI